jgi:tetratricopeptide (TPR) repeat protein
MKLIVRILASIVLSLQLNAQNPGSVQKEADSESLLKEAIAHFDGNRFDNCLNALNQAIQINHNGELSDILYYYRALANLKLEQEDKAVSDLDTAILFNDKKLNYLNLRIELKMRQLSFEEALSDIEKVLSIDASSEAALVNKGIILQERGEIQKSLNLYSTALKINPKNAEALYFRGMIYLQNLMAEKGCQDLELAANIGYKAAIEALKRYCK